MPSRDETGPVVAVRVRPLNERELTASEESVIRCTSDTEVSVGGGAAFTFDHCFPEASTQAQVYEAIGAPLLQRAFDGYNSTLMAYGQTASGKSHSMTGSEATPGIIPSVIGDLFERIAAVQAASPTLRVEVQCSFLEIYNETCVDLLENSGKLEIKEHPQSGVFVAGLTHAPVDSADAVHRLMARGNASRAVAATGMNGASSRSHTIFSLTVLQVTEQAAEGGAARERREVSAKLNLVDLAGSERQSKTGASGETLKEGSSINKSLSALGNVISALSISSQKRHAAAAAATKPHVPYRDSKLTRVLQESLGGNSIVVLLATLSPAASNADESVNTLQFAERAKGISMRARRNERSTSLAEPTHQRGSPAAARLKGKRGAVAKPRAHGGGVAVEARPSSSRSSRRADTPLQFGQSVMRNFWGGGDLFEGLEDELEEGEEGEEEGSATEEGSGSDEATGEAQAWGDGLGVGGGGTFEEGDELAVAE